MRTMACPSSTAVPSGGWHTAACRRCYGGVAHSRGGPEPCSSTASSEPHVPYQAPVKGHVVVVGAGPAGCLAAISLAQRGYRVNIFEKRSKEELSGSGPFSRGGNAFIMVLNSRAISALEAAGVQLPALGPDAPPFKGAYQARHLRRLNNLSDPFQRFHAVDRLQLGREMWQEAQRLYPSSLEFHFGHDLQRINTKTRTAEFTLPPGTSAPFHGPAPSTAGMGPLSVHQFYDLIIGADGTASAVRKQLESQVPGFSSKVLYQSNRTYKTVTGLPRDVPGAESFADGFLMHQPLEYVYFNEGKGNCPRATLWVNRDNAVTCMLSAWDDWDGADAKSRLHAAITQSHPHIPLAWVDAIAEQCVDTSKPRKFGRIVRCSQLAAGRVVLLGDAGHSTTAAIGQGCNSALESCAVLGRVLDACGNDLDRVPDMFNEARLRDVHALQAIDLMVISTASPDSQLPGLAQVATQLLARAVIMPRVLLGAWLPKLILPLPIELGDRRRSFFTMWLVIRLQAVAFAVGLVLLLWAGIVAAKAVAAAVGAGSWLPLFFATFLRN